MTVFSDYRTVPVLRDASFPGDLEAIVAEPVNQTLDVVIGLTDVSDIVAFTSPRDGMKVASAAVKLASELPERSPQWYLGYSRSFSALASRLRGIAKLDDADAMYTASFNMLRGIPGRHFEERADLYRRLGFLRIDQRALDAGFDFANDSKLFFERAGNEHGVGCSLICRGNVYMNWKRYDRAAGDYRTALGFIDADRGFIHVWIGSINLANSLIDSASSDHDIEEAIRQLQRVNDLGSYEENTVQFLLVRWAEARLLMKLGEHFPAQAKLLSVCDTCRSLDLPYELTQASLDLARCYFEQNLLGEIIGLAGGMFPLFSRFRHDKRAYRALMRFHQATLKGRLEAAMIVDARAAVESAGIA